MRQRKRLTGLGGFLALPLFLLPLPEPGAAWAQAEAVDAGPSAPCSDAGECPRVVPPHSTLHIADDPQTAEDETELLVVPTEHQLWPRRWVDNANAQAQVNRVTLGLLADVRKQLEEERKRTVAREESPFLAATKWVIVGTAIGGAMVLGMIIGLQVTP